MSWPMTHSRSVANAVSNASRRAIRCHISTVSIASDSILSSLSKSNEASSTSAAPSWVGNEQYSFRDRPCLPSQPSSRFASTTAAPEPDVSENNTNPKQSLEQHKITILSKSLEHVHEKGWTEDAIASATLSLNLPPTLMGLIPNRPYDLISYFMKQCNNDLITEIEQHLKPRWAKEEGTTVAMKLEEMLKIKLSYILPFVQSKRWAEAMAIGVSTPDRAMTTAALLDEMATTVLDAALEGTGRANGLSGLVEQAAITTVYASTELHLLADDSVGNEDTWRFLRERILELERVAIVTSHGTAGSGSGMNGSNMTTSDAMVAASAVASSLGGAVLSLAAPAASAAASTVAPSLMSFVQQVQPLSNTQHGVGGVGNAGTRPSDYYDKDEERENVDKILDGLPPLEEEGSARSK